MNLYIPWVKFHPWRTSMRGNSNSKDISPLTWIGIPRVSSLRNQSRTYMEKWPQFSARALALSGSSKAWRNSSVTLGVGMPTTQWCHIQTGANPACGPKVTEADKKRNYAKRPELSPLRIQAAVQVLKRNQVSQNKIIRPQENNVDIIQVHNPDPHL